MQFSEQWLRQWANPLVNTAELTEALTMLGLEVDACVPVAKEFSGVVVGEVVSREPHPNADRLSFCRVNIGESELLEVVCGAPNVRQGLKVAFVKVGGVLPGNFVINKAKLRGIESHGMICSARELGMSEDHAGILELRADAPVGMNFRDYLQLDDHIIEIGLTPNRGDCANIQGIAREIAAKFHCELKSPSTVSVAPIHQETFPIEVQAETECPHYVGRVIRGIDNTILTPLWMQERLRRSNIRSINLIVDLTNYVMLELGQPMHAFNLDQLAEKIIIRGAKANETITLLDEQTMQLSEGTLVIADVKRAVAVAGVMGGQETAVNESTTVIFLESAYFDPTTVTRSVRQLGVASDSSYRFERGVDFELQINAVERFTQLLLEITQGEPGPVIEFKSRHLPRRKPIILRVEQIQRILGITFKSSEVESILSSLGMQVQTETDHWVVTAPSYRFDITVEVDLIEELARMWGYHQLPATMMVGELKIPTQAVSTALFRMPQLLTDLGYYEAITYSFVDPNLQLLFDPQREYLSLSNPIAADMSVMRTSLWPGLVQALRFNLNRQAQRVRLFETGLCFIRENGILNQVNKVAGLIAGEAHDLQWAYKNRQVDFYDVKGDIEQLFAKTHREKELVYRPSSHPALHPGQSADLYLDDYCVGSVGALHPRLVAELDLSLSPFLFELNRDILYKTKTKHYENFSKFPTVRRDLAIVIENKITAEAIEKHIKQSAGHLLLEVRIFDIYQGEGIEKGKKSVALSLFFQDAERTLVDEVVNQVIAGVVAGLQQEFNAQLRA